ncbi:hypothetical protein LINPERPRIM_LOCUS8032 [Linum perenne]
MKKQGMGRCCLILRTSHGRSPISQSLKTRFIQMLLLQEATDGEYSVSQREMMSISFPCIWTLLIGKAMPPRWSKYADFNLTLVNQFNSTHSRKFCTLLVVGVSNAAPEKVIEAEAEDQSKGDSTSPSLSGKVARTSTITSPSSSSLQFTSKNLIAELSTIASIWGSTSVDGIPVSKTNDATNHHVSALPQQERDKLIEFLEMSLEAISQHNRFDNVHDLVLKISEHATDPFEKTVLKDLLSRVVEFKNTIPRSLSMIETSHEVEASSAQATKELEGSLVRRQKQLAFLESEVSRIEEVVMKVEAELQLLGALKQKLVDEKSLTVAEMEITNREACRELGELKSKHRTQASQGE